MFGTINVQNSSLVIRCNEAEIHSMCFFLSLEREVFNNSIFKTEHGEDNNQTKFHCFVLKHNFIYVAGWALASNPMANIWEVIGICQECYQLKSPMNEEPRYTCFC